MLKGQIWLGLFVVGSALGLAACLSWALSARGGMDLSGWPAAALCGLTETGGVRLVPVVLLVGLALWATDPDSPRARCRRGTFGMLVVMAVGLPAAAIVNEYVVKPVVPELRPSHLRMAEAGIIPNLDAFRRLDPHARRELLASRVSAVGRDRTALSLAVHPAVLDQWLRETSNTFPSGHSLNAFLAAVLFLGGALVEATRRRRRLAGIAIVWAVGVGLTRVLLLVHRPIDVSTGAVIGAVLGGLLLIPWCYGTRRA